MALRHQDPATAGTGPNLSPVAVFSTLVSAPARLSRNRPNCPAARVAAARHQPPGVNFWGPLFCGWRDPGHRPRRRGSRRPAEGSWVRGAGRRCDVGAGCVRRVRRRLLAAVAGRIVTLPAPAGQTEAAGCGAAKSDIVGAEGRKGVRGMQPKDTISRSWHSAARRRPRLAGVKTGSKRKNRIHEDRGKAAGCIPAWP